MAAVSRTAVASAVALTCLCGPAHSVLAADSARAAPDVLAELSEAARRGFAPLWAPSEEELVELEGLRLDLGSAGDRPTIPKQWSSELFYEGEFMNIPFKDGKGNFYYDGLGGRYIVNYTAREDYFDPSSRFYHAQAAAKLPNGTQQNMTMGRGVDGGCMSFSSPMKSYDLFAWVKFASFGGNKTIRGTSCSVYRLEMKAMSSIQEVCVDSNNMPLELNQTFGGPGSKFSGSSYMQFVNYTVGFPGEAAFAPFLSCAKAYPAPPCEDKGVARIDTFRIWGPPEPKVLDNRDTGDVMGDLSFVCTQGSGPMYRSKLITHWQVNISTKFAQYALCNYNGKENVCTAPPSSLQRVGRRSGQMCGKGPFMGQCSDNDDVGSQFSFPLAAKCQDGTSPSADGCAWGGEVPVRTVNASCVMEERGLLAACAGDIGHAPFKDAMEVWNKAFASTDPAKGGCPDVNLPEVVVPVQVIV